MIDIIRRNGYALRDYGYAVCPCGVTFHRKTSNHTWCTSCSFQRNNHKAKQARTLPPQEQLYEINHCRLCGSEPTEPFQRYDGAKWWRCACNPTEHQLVDKVVMVV